MGDHITLDRVGPVAAITLDRPERHNSLIPELLTQLGEAIDSATLADEVGAIVLRASGRSFSTGGDVAAFWEAGDAVAEYAREIVGLLNETMLAMLRSPKPIVCAVQGMVTGGSMGLVLASDIVVVSPEASFTPWYTVVGFSPDGGWTALLPRIIGRQRAAAVLLRNATISAEDAVAWGIASELVSHESLVDEAHAIAAGISDRRHWSGATAKRLLGGDVAAVAAALEAERSAFVAQITSAEARRGMAAFLGYPPP